MLTSIFSTLGIGSLSALYILQFSGDALIFPYESLIYLVYMSFGVMEMKHFMKLYGIKIVFTLIWIVVIMVLWWKLVGIM